jgi:hypothetical protein
MTVQDAEQWFQENLRDVVCSDVAEHLVLLKRYAACCDTITELGTYDGTTALAFLMGRPKSLRCVDIDRRAEVDRLHGCANALGVQFEFILGRSEVVGSWATDLLYIDTWHFGEQVLAELNHWADSVGKYILLHDTEIHGDVGMCDGQGMWVGIGQFLKEHPEWALCWHKENALGLSCLIRIAT